MTQEQAFAQAVAAHGPTARAGHNPQYKDKPFFIGTREHGEWTKFGAGNTWEEALAAVVPVIDAGSGKFFKETK
jgi:hypothetical protein